MLPTLQEIRTSAIPSAIPSAISRRILCGAATLVLALGAAGALAQAALPTVEVFKSPYCGCCTDWVKHMQAAGFAVKVHNVDDTQAARAAAGMPDSLASCHTAKVGGYAIEGHVPAQDIRRLLVEKPKAVGLAVPGMPQGAPGMEVPKPQPYDTLLVSREDGREKISVFARH